MQKNKKLPEVLTEPLNESMKRPSTTPMAFKIPKKPRLEENLSDRKKIFGSQTSSKDKRSQQESTSSHLIPTSFPHGKPYSEYVYGLASENNGKSHKTKALLKEKRDKKHSSGDNFREEHSATSLKAQRNHGEAENSNRSTSYPIDSARHNRYHKTSMYHSHVSSSQNGNNHSSDKVVQGNQFLKNLQFVRFFITISKIFIHLSRNRRSFDREGRTV